MEARTSLQLFLEFGAVFKAGGMRKGLGGKSGPRPG